LLPRALLLSFTLENERRNKARASARAEFRGRKTEGKEDDRSSGKNAMMKKKFSLGCYPIERGRRLVVVVISSSLKNKISLPKRTFAVSHLRVGDGGSLLLLGDNLGDDLGAGDLGL